MAGSVVKPMVILYFLSCFLAFIGGHVMNYTAIMYAQEVFQSDLIAGIGFGLCFGPAIILGWIAGVYCDRMPPSNIVMASQLLFMLAGGLFFTLNSIEIDRYFEISLYLLACFIVGVAWSFLSPSRLAALAQIVPSQALHQATVLFNLLIMIGFGLAPILIAIIKTSYDWAGVFITISSLFLLASLMLIKVRTQATTSKTKSVLYQAKQGLGAAIATPLLWQLLICSMLVYALLGPMQVLLPRIAISVLGYSELGRGLFLGILALALIIGGILCMLFSKKAPLGIMILLCIIAGASGLYALSQSTTTLSAVIALIVAGVTGGYGVSLIVAGLQENAPDHVRGRIMSIYTITSQVLPAISGLLAGALSQQFGVSMALQICAIIVVILGFAGVLRLKAVRVYKSARAQ